MHATWTRRRAGLLVAAALLVASACEQSTAFDPVPQFNRGKKNGGGNPAASFTFEAPTNSTAPSTTGIFGVGGVYVHQQDGVQAYLGVSGKDANLVTNGTARVLRYVFPTESAAWAASGIPADFVSQTVLYGINWSMRYDEMAINSVGLVKADFEFYDGRIGYELVYYNLAVKRLSATEWLLTTDCLRLDPDGCWNYGFTPSSAAELNVVRRKKQQSYGTVAMPVTFIVRLE